VDELLTSNLQGIASATFLHTWTITQGNAGSEFVRTFRPAQPVIFWGGEFEALALLYEFLQDNTVSCSRDFHPYIEILGHPSCGGPGNSHAG